MEADQFTNTHGCFMLQELRLNTIIDELYLENLCLFLCVRSADANKSSVLDDFFGDSFPYQGTGNTSEKKIPRYAIAIKTEKIQVKQ